MLLAGVEKPLRTSMPEFKRIVDINHKLPNWMHIVKKKIARQGKDKMGKGKP